jgi:hypothetical protein
MDIAKAKCANCEKPMAVARMGCIECGLTLEGQFETSPLARLAPDDQVFVTAFVRYHGSIKKMEELFEISYPTVKNRLNAISAALDSNYIAPVTHAGVLEQLARGEISVDEALASIK